MPADRAKKISELTATTSAVANDQLAIVTNTAGTAVTKKITVGNLFGNVSTSKVNATSICVGNSTVNVAVNSTVITVGTDLSINTTSIKVGNSTINATLSATTLQINGSNAVIQANTYQWAFNKDDGWLYFPKGTGNTAAIIFPNDPGGGSGDSAHIKYTPANSEDMILELRVRNNNDDLIRLDTSGSIEVIAAGTTTIKKWIFSSNGALRFPDNTAQTTAWAGIPGPYADDTAAAAANVAVGYPYYKTGTGGQVFVRLT